MSLKRCSVSLSSRVRRNDQGLATDLYVSPFYFISPQCCNLGLICVPREDGLYELDRYNVAKGGSWLRVAFRAHDITRANSSALHTQIRFAHIFFLTTSSLARYLTAPTPSSSALNSWQHTIDLLCFNGYSRFVSLRVIILRGAFAKS